MEENKKLKSRLKILLLESETNIKELALKTGYTEQNLRRLWKEPPNANMTTIFKVCVALNCQPGDLLVIK